MSLENDNEKAEVPETLLSGKRNTQLFQYFVHEDRRRAEQETYLESLTGTTKSKQKEIVHAYQNQQKMKKDMLPIVLNAEEELANVKSPVRRSSLLQRTPRPTATTQN